MNAENINNFTEWAGKVGNNYEKLIADAFNEIKENEIEIADSIHALYQGPESFVVKAEEDLQNITNKFNRSVEESREQLKKYRKFTFITCGLAIVITCITCLIALLFLFFNASLQEFFATIGKNWSMPGVIFVILLVLGLSIFLTYCFVKGRRGY